MSMLLECSILKYSTSHSKSQIEFNRDKTIVMTTEHRAAKSMSTTH